MHGAACIRPRLRTLACRKFAVDRDIKRDRLRLLLRRGIDGIGTIQRRFCIDVIGAGGASGAESGVFPAASHAMSLW